jgi:hypothetical protein
MHNFTFKIAHSLHPRKPEQWVVWTVTESWAFVLATWYARNDDNTARTRRRRSGNDGASRKRVRKARGTATASAGLLQLPHRRKDNERPNELEEWLKAQQRLIRNAEARQANEKPDKERQAEAMKALGMSYGKKERRRWVARWRDRARRVAPKLCNTVGLLYEASQGRAL